ncbi:unnamed protein product, partial [Musa acuminata subsp. burmannicoides]
LLLFLLRRRTIPSRHSSSLHRSPPAPRLVAAPFLLSPIPPSPSPFRHSSPASPTSSSSSLLLLHPLSPFIAAPAPLPWSLPSSTSSQPPPLSIFLLRPRQPPLHYPAPAPTAPISIFLLQLRRPPFPSSTPLFALSIHLPLAFPTP